MGKLLEFKPRAPKPVEEPDMSGPVIGSFPVELDIQNLEELKKLFTEEEIEGIKTELDFLNELDDVGVTPPDPEVGES